MLLKYCRGADLLSEPDRLLSKELTLGKFMRNNFGLWEGNPYLILDCAEDAGSDI
jgi:hypothetical protein